MFQLVLFMLFLGAIRADQLDTHEHHQQVIGKEWAQSWNDVQDCTILNTSVTCEGPNITEISSDFPRSIQQITFTKTAVKAIPYKVFMNYTELTQIEFEKNSIETISKGAFYGLTKLETLQLDLNGLSDESFGYEPFEGLQSLTEISLQKNYLTTFPLHLFVGASMLKTINLQSCSINDMGPALDVAFKNITSIDLSDNRLKSLNASIFDQMPNLQTLLLQGNLISAIENGKAFLKMEFLTKLNLDYNKIQCDCKASWMLEARNTKKNWAQEWVKVRYLCGLPKWMELDSILDLLPVDLTCDIPNITPITSTTTSQTIPFTIKAKMTHGQPYSTWVTPVGTTTTDIRAPVYKNDIRCGRVHAVINPIDHSVETTLNIMERFDDYIETPGVINNFTLMATNVMGSSSITFMVDISASGAVGSPPVYTGTLLLMLISALIVIV